MMPGTFLMNSTSTHDATCVSAFCALTLGHQGLLPCFKAGCCQVQSTLYVLQQSSVRHDLCLLPLIQTICLPYMSVVHPILLLTAISGLWSKGLLPTVASCLNDSALGCPFATPTPAECYWLQATHHMAVTLTHDAYSPAKCLCLSKPYSTFSSWSNCF